MPKSITVNNNFYQGNQPQKSESVHMQSSLVLVSYTVLFQSNVQKTVK